MSSRILPEQIDKFVALLGRGASIKAASHEVGIHENSGRAIVARMRDAGHDPLVRVRTKPLPVNWARLTDPAKRGYDDFEFFRRRCLGRISMPWQVTAAQEAIEALETPEESFFIWNMPPGGGKTTLTHDITAWAIVRNRQIRVLFGSLTAGNAEKQVKRLSRSLANTVPRKAKPRDLELELACHATGTIAGDYGSFKPYGPDADTWRANEFIVVQADGGLVAEKDPTVSSYGKNSGFLGSRFDLVWWDDVIDRTTVRNIDMVTDWQEWWDDAAETRLEPGGAMFLVGQRIASNDGYRYNLDKMRPLTAEEEVRYDDATDDEKASMLLDVPKMYTPHIFRAHDPDKCGGALTHRRDSKPQPEGCLLDPRRLHWTKIGALRQNKPRTFAIQYQQEDADPESSLVRRPWIYGGTDIDEVTGIRFDAPGCLDRDRGVCELPKGLIGPLISIATVDPSPTKLWAIQWWIYAPNAFNQVFLMDTIRRSMGGNELLDFNPNTGSFYGVMEDWQRRSDALGVPIKHWIVEVNAAQKFLLQNMLQQKWRVDHQVNVIGHTTTIHKLDEKLGVDMVKDWWKYGRIRLPFLGQAAITSLKLIEEVLRYPHAGTDDQVMAHWFLFANLPKLAVGESTTERMWRPSYISDGSLDARRLVAVR